MANTKTLQPGSRVRFSPVGQTPGGRSAFLLIRQGKRALIALADETFWVSLSDLAVEGCARCGGTGRVGLLRRRCPECREAL